MEQNTYIYIERARLLLEQGRHPDAEKELKKALAADPENDEALAMLGRLHLDKGQDREALKLIDEALSLSPDEDYYHYLKGFALYKLGDYRKATEWTSQALALDNRQPGYYALFALILMEERKFTDALDLAEEGLAIDPENITCLNVRTQALIKLGRTTEAIETIQATLAADPENDYSHTNAGFSFLEKGKHQQSASHFREALRLNPANMNARDGLKEALKSKIPPYRWILQYEYWLNNRGRGARIVFILGIYFGIRLLTGIAEKLPKPIAILIYIVFGLYLLMVIISWLIKPLGNLFLTLHPEGKYAVTPNEKINSYTVFGALLLGIGLLLVSFILPVPEKEEPKFFMAALVTASMAIPLGMLRYPLGQFRSFTRQWVGLICVGMGLIAIIGLLLPSLGTLGIGTMLLYGIMLVAGTWIAAFSK
jgi:tetratricopeptide (TPR) repeat protein